MNFSIDLLEPDPAVRINALYGICEETLPTLTGNPDEVNWQSWFYVYLLWHESAQLTTRRQFNHGPGRGLMQFEATTAWDLIKVYVLGETKGLVARLAEVMEVDRTIVMLPALRAFADAVPPRNNVWPAEAPRNNVWPAEAPQNQVEQWLLTSDSFGLTLMQLQFERYRVALPPLPPFTLTDNPRDPAVHAQFAALWADHWWKGPAAVRPARIAQFLSNAQVLDQALS